MHLKQASLLSKEWGAPQLFLSSQPRLSVFVFLCLYSLPHSRPINYFSNVALRFGGLRSARQSRAFVWGR